MQAYNTEYPPYTIITEHKKRGDKGNIRMAQKVGRQDPDSLYVLYTCIIVFPRIEASFK